MREILALAGTLIGLAVGVGLCYLYWLAIGQPQYADMTSLVGVLITIAPGAAGFLIGDRIGDRRAASKVPCRRCGRSGDAYRPAREEAK